MLKLNQDKLSLFTDRLQECQENDVSLTIREVVVKTFDQIAVARERKISWETIAKLLSEIGGDGYHVSARTLQNYFSQAEKDRSQRSKKKQSKSRRDQRPQRSFESSHENQRPGQSEVALQESSATHSEHQSGHTQLNLHEHQKVVYLSKEMSTEGSQSPQKSQKWVEPEFNVNRVRPKRPISHE